MRTSCQEPEGLLSLVPGVHGPGQRLHLSAGNALIEVRVRLPHLPHNQECQAQCISAVFLPNIKTQPQGINVEQY